jgi:hypothetical protein
MNSACCCAFHLAPAESLRKHAGAIAAQGVAVDSSVTLPCGDVAWVAQHKVTKQRCALLWENPMFPCTCVGVKHTEFYVLIIKRLPVWHDLQACAWVLVSDSCQALKQA